jgi:hypothetical protein
MRTELLGEFLALPGMHGNLVPDAHLAALAVEHGLTLCSTDGDFARFRAVCVGLIRSAKWMTSLNFAFASATVQVLGLINLAPF